MERIHPETIESQAWTDRVQELGDADRATHEQRRNELISRPWYKYAYLPSVEFYESGVKLRSGGKCGNPSGKGGGRRGKVKGWSKASRRRLREFLLTMCVPASHNVGFTFTIPGPLLPDETVSGLWKHWKTEAQRCGWGCVWRVEKQSRKQIHFHGIVSVENESVTLKDFRWAVRDSWFSALDWLGPFEYEVPVTVGRLEVLGVNSLSAWPGAEAHCVEVSDGSGSKGQWLRYLQDHSSKAKQGQIAEGFGRHWGVVGRAKFKPRLPESVAQFDDLRTYTKMLRAFQRLTTPVMKRDGVIFGKRLGWRNRRGSRGASVWFSNVETVKRLVEWAEKERRDEMEA